ncbi:MAG: 50S ribosomal protein L1 [Vigna little leaf phytoplasma]|nr:50S ribosomal protein L1 [Vigna little leaf phytoplasma]
MMKRSKKYLSVVNKIDLKKLYNLSQAVELLKEIKITKFDATVECSFSLNLDPKKVEQNLRLSFVLPHGSGKILKVAVVTKGLKLKEAEEAQADFVGEQDLLDKIAKNWFDFDVLVATPDMMPAISKLGRLLGPKGLMPNPKLGTVTENITQIVKDIKKGRVEYKVDKTGNLHTILGKVSFSNEQIIDNFKFTYDYLNSLKPKTVKGNFIKSLTLSTTMSPGIRIENKIN